MSRVQACVWAERARLAQVATALVLCLDNALFSASLVLGGSIASGSVAMSVTAARAAVESAPPRAAIHPCVRRRLCVCVLF